MQLSLADFLRTGRWGDIAAGATKQEIEALLGPPLQTGGTSRKHRTPSLWKWGSLEIGFAEPERERASMLVLEPVGDAFVFPDSWRVSDDGLRFGMAGSAVRAWLADREIDVKPDPRCPSPALTVVGSGIGLYFLEDGTLWSVCG